MYMYMYMFVYININIYIYQQSILYLRCVKRIRISLNKIMHIHNIIFGG